MVLVTLTYSMFYKRIWPFEVPPNQKMNLVTKTIIVGSISAVVVSVTTAASNTKLSQNDFEAWSWIDTIYIFGWIKLLATFVKYIPQAWFNYKRKSTQGWSIGQILFDFAGGILSLAQLFIDASFQADWSGITGNPAKFGLSNISLFFDVVFITQHYVLYRKPHDQDEQDDTRPLLEDS